MGASCDSAETATDYYNFSIGSEFSDKIEVLNLGLKFYPAEGLDRQPCLSNFTVLGQIIVDISIRPNIHV